MKFTKGLFKTMQVADVHQKPLGDPDTSRLLGAALDRYRPDLVIFTGDQLKGYGLSYKGGRKKEKVLKAFESFLQPLVKRSTPFTVTFGNHDAQTGLSNKEQLEIYKTFPGFIKTDTFFDEGTGCIYIYDENGEKPLFTVVLMDTKGKEKGGYEGIGKGQLNWFMHTREQEERRWGSKAKAMVFQHIPLEEYYAVLHQVPFLTKGALWGHGQKKKRAYFLENQKEEESFYEAPCIPTTNSGAFAAYQKDGDVLAVFCGHDHKNNFVRPYMGIDLGYTPSCGFDEYGPGTNRGVRVIDLYHHQGEVTYQSHVLTYEQLLGSKVTRPVKNWFYNIIPTSKETAIQMLVRMIKRSIVLAGVLFLAWFIISKI